MNRIGGIMMAAGGRMARIVAGFAGMMLAVGAMMPAPVPDVPARLEPWGPGSAMDTIVLTVPEDQLARNLTITDETGRELATLTYYRTGSTLMVARREGGPDLACWLQHSKDRAALEWTGASHTTRIQMNSDGTAQLYTRPSLRLGSRERYADRVLPAPDGDPPRLLRSSVGSICTLANHGHNSDGGSGHHGNLWQFGCLSPLDDRARDGAVMPACP